MTPGHIALGQHSCADVIPMTDIAAMLFNERLFTLDPPLRSLVHSARHEQGHKLMTVLKIAVLGLSRLQE